jgi:hypothetical protein
MARPDPYVYVQCTSAVYMHASVKPKNHFPIPFDSQAGRWAESVADDVGVLLAASVVRSITSS